MILALENQNFFSNLKKTSIQFNFVKSIKPLDKIYFICHFLAIYVSKITKKVILIT